MPELIKMNGTKPFAISNTSLCNLSKRAFSSGGPIIDKISPTVIYIATAQKKKKTLLKKIEIFMLKKYRRFSAGYPVLPRIRGKSVSY